MILSEIRDYLQERGQVSLQELALHFDSDSDALRGMLAHWIRKGQVSRHSTAASCGSRCTQCDPASVEFYVWGDGGVVEQAVPLVRDLGCAR